MKRCILKQNGEILLRILAVGMLLLMLPAFLIGCDNGGELGGDTTFPVTEEELPPLYPDAGVVILHEPGKSVPYEDALVKALSKSAQVTVLDWNTVNDDAFDEKKTQVLILTDADRVEGNLLKKADFYRKRGGNLIVLGGPLCEEIPFRREDGSFSTLNEFLSTSNQVHIQMNFSDKAQVSRIGRNSSNPSVQRVITTGDFGLGRTSLRLQNGYYDGWDLMVFPFKAPKDDNMICFYAKASGAKTLYLELYMKDGTRWLGPTLQTSEDWTFYTVAKEDFVLYSGTNRTLAFENIEAFWLGGTSLEKGKGYTLYLDTLATGAFDTADEKVSATGLTDYEEFYQINNGKRMTAYAGQVLLGERAYTMPDEIYSTMRAMEGTGSNKGRDGRFVPLLEVFDEKGLHSGYAAWLNFYDDGSLSAFPMGDAFFDENGVSAVNELVRYLLGQTRLVTGGTACYVYEKDETSIQAKASCYVPYGGQVRFTFTRGNEVLLTETVACEASKYKKNSDVTLTLAEKKPDRVRVELLVDGNVVDQITHPILCLGENTATESFVTVKNGVFQKDDKPLQLVGINYFSCYGGIVPSCSFTSNEVYDPYLVKCDLERIKEIGFNAISLQIAPWADANEVLNGKNRNMTHVIAMARELGLYVDIFVPFADDMSKFTTIVEKLHLQEFDNIVAYDINWEGMIGTYASLSDAEKHNRDREWTDWVKAQYGSIAAAEALFGIACPTNADFDALLAKTTTNGAEVKLAVAFRRFMDDKVSAYYAAQVNRIKDVDPNHLVSFRCCDAGLPSAVTSKSYYYDFSGFCGALDFVSPEGYGFTSYQYNASSYEGAFAEAYARLMCGDTTTVWKEFGWQAYSGNNYKPLQSNMEYCSQIYQKVYDSILMGVGGGSYGWWYAGGLRADEGSDYGVVNPDGSDRPATKVVREYLERLLAVEELKQADVVITVDRDLYANGLQGIWNAVKTEFIAAVSAGKTVSLVSAGSDLSVKEAVLIALDGTESTIGPRKYLNSILSYALDANGKEVLSGQRSGTATVTLTIANTGFTAWGEGEVTLSDQNGNVLAALPALSQGERAEVTVTLSEAESTIRACAEGVFFGNSFVIKR